jgi:hypothetical protein
VADGGEMQDRALEVAPRLASARLGERSERLGYPPSEGAAQRCGAYFCRSFQEFAYGLGEPRKQSRARWARGLSAVAGKDETTEEIVACGRQARAETDEPSRRAAHGVEAPCPYAPAEIEGGSRQPLAHRTERLHRKKERRDAQVRRRALLQRVEQCHAPAPARSRAGERRRRLRIDAARRGTIDTEYAELGRRLKHNRVIAEHPYVAGGEP